MHEDVFPEVGEPWVAVVLVITLAYDLGVGVRTYEKLAVTRVGELLLKLLEFVPDHRHHHGALDGVLFALPARQDVGLV